MTPRSEVQEQVDQAIADTEWDVDEDVQTFAHNAGLDAYMDCILLYSSKEDSLQAAYDAAAAVIEERGQDGI